VLDLHDMLVGYVPGTSNANDFVHLSEVDGNTWVTVSPDSVSEFVNLIVLDGVTGALLGDMLTQGNLVM
jgi:hypothetical protein